jgi:hypothetical protein
MAVSDATLLAITGIDIPEFALRGLTQSIEPIAAAAGNIRRDINGVLRSKQLTEFQKYKSTVSCTDLAGPGLPAIWPGLPVTMVTLSDLLGPDPVTMGMLVIGWKASRDEWGAITGWSIDFEQV